MLDNIRIVLSHTTHPGNIGATARAMKTMGLKQLALIKPKFFPDQRAIAMSAGAEDILENASVSHSFTEAISDCQLVIGTSARSRSVAWPLLEPRECAAMIATGTQRQVAIVFGPEHSGLTNEELRHCHYHVMIPTNPDYSSLNLAAAVQIIAYELRLASRIEHCTEDEPRELPTTEEMEFFYQHLENTLMQIRFINPEKPKKITQRLRRLYQRANLDKTELNILNGILTETLRQIK